MVNFYYFYCKLNYSITERNEFGNRKQIVFRKGKGNGNSVPKGKGKKGKETVKNGLYMSLMLQVVTT